MRYLVMVLLGVALVAAGVAGSAWLLPRYQIERVSMDIIVRLDTRTGAMRLYGVARPDRRLENGAFEIYPIRADDER